MRTLKIRLRRVGRWKKPVYSVIVTFNGVPVKSGKYCEKLGFYSPSSFPKFFFLNFNRLSYWLMRGAVTTETVNLLVSKVLPSSKLKN